MSRRAVFKEKSLRGRDGFGEAVDGDIVREKEGVGGVDDDAVSFGDANFFSAVVEDQRLEGILCSAGFVSHGGGKKLGENEMAVGRPAEGIDDVAEGLVAAAEFLAFEKAAALAAGVLEPDVVVFEVVELGFEFAVDGVDDAAVGSVGEGGDFFVDGLEGLVEILGSRALWKEEKEREEEKKINAESETRRRGRREDWLMAWDDPRCRDCSRAAARACTP